MAKERTEAAKRRGTEPRLGRHRRVESHPHDAKAHHAKVRQQPSFALLGFPNITNAIRTHRRSWYTLFLLLVVTALPVLLTRELWFEVWSGARSHAWDGSGHLALARIYEETIFPDTFGWTNAFLGGMPFPNFYPPLFYWLVALLHHTHLFSLITAFKIVLVLPTLLLPGAIWVVACKASDKNRLVATSAAMMVLPVLIDYRFYNQAGMLMGLSYTSTFLLGLYTHPLGFVLLLAWYAIYSNSSDYQTWRFALASVLLALALLANFFALNVAMLFIAATVIYDFVRMRRAPDSKTQQQIRNLLIAHLISPLVAACLTLFWLAPAIGASVYFPSSPSSIPFSQLVSTAMFVWYLLAAIGVFFWIREPTTGMWPYLGTCVVLALVVVFAGTISPAWLPLHAERLLAMFNFLLAVPAAHLGAFVLQKAWTLLSPKQRTRQRFRKGEQSRSEVLNKPQPIHMTATVVALLTASLVAFALIKPSSFKLAFYPTNTNEVVDPILGFAQQHKDGRYLIETTPFSDTETAHDGRAIGAYLGAQGNESLSLFFREASPSVIFFNSLIRSLSVYGDATNLSSMLIDDTDFARQPVANHLAQARFIGTRYLVTRSPWAKNRLAAEPAIKSRIDFGPWTIHELQGEQFSAVQLLHYKPALVVSKISLKQRRRDQYEFVRFAEEQFADGWFDVLLAHSAEIKIDHLNVPAGFGALIVDTYQYDDENAAFTRLREFAQQRPLILLAGDNPLFRRLQSSIADFPQATIIERAIEGLVPGCQPARQLTATQ